MVSNAETIWGRLTRREGLTVTHGDTHWWNFMFPHEAEHGVKLIDWQLWHIDLGARDLAFLLALGGFAEPRPELELELLRIYHKELQTAGVQVGFDELWDDYRMSAIRNLNIPVIFRAQGKRLSTWQTARRRSFGSFERLKCRELLS